MTVSCAGEARCGCVVFCPETACTLCFMGEREKERKLSAHTKKKAEQVAERGEKTVYFRVWNNRPPLLSRPREYD